MLNDETNAKTTNANANSRTTHKGKKMSFSIGWSYHFDTKEIQAQTRNYLHKNCQNNLV